MLGFKGSLTTVIKNLCAKEKEANFVPKASADSKLYAVFNFVLKNYRSVHSLFLQLTVTQFIFINYRTWLHVSLNYYRENRHEDFSYMLTVARLVKKFQALQGSKRFITVFTRAWRMGTTV